MKYNKKAQLGIGEAPGIVLIVGLVFLVMATMAVIGEKYGEALDVEGVVTTVSNETVSSLTNQTGAGDYLSNYWREDAICTVTLVKNATSGVTVPANNYTVSNCLIKAESNSLYVGRDVKVDYTYKSTVESVSSNLTTDMNTELGNNSSIAGIVLTISLVGIVLTLLIGVFIGIKRGSRV